MKAENFNDKLSEALAKLKHEENKKGKTCIDQLINDISENDWYCDQNGSQSDMKNWEKSAIIAGLMLLLMEG